MNLDSARTLIHIKAYAMLLALAMKKLIVPVVSNKNTATMEVFAQVLILPTVSALLWTSDLVSLHNNLNVHVVGLSE
jgi:hypothetical protein